MPKTKPKQKPVVQRRRFKDGTPTPTLTSTKRLLLAALRVWELKQRDGRFQMPKLTLTGKDSTPTTMVDAVSAAMDRKIMNAETRINDLVREYAADEITADQFYDCGRLLGESEGSMDLRLRKYHKTAKVSLTLTIQKEVKVRARDRVVKRLEREGWAVNVTDEEEPDERAGDPGDPSEYGDS